MVAGVMASAVTLAAFGCEPEAPPTTSPDIMDDVTTTVPNGSSDGRYHTCGYITEDGVTEYLDTYEARCGEGQDGGAPELIPPVTIVRQDLPATG